jgi:cytidylate kinase
MTRPKPPALVTISASYGSGGSVVGPGVAERLGVPFVDRAIPVAVAERLAAPLGQALAAENPSLGLGRLLASFAQLATLAGAGPRVGARTEPRAGDFNAQTEQLLWELAETTGGVVLGRGGAIVLAEVSHALHVRLDGPTEARLQAAIERHGVERAQAERAMTQTDRARLAYVRHFYRRDARDPSLYHLVIDGTAVPLETCVDLIAIAVLPRLRAARR